MAMIWEMEIWDVGDRIHILLFQEYTPSAYGSLSCVTRRSLCLCTGLIVSICTMDRHDLNNEYLLAGEFKVARADLVTVTKDD
jgi:hypothetical protein